MDDDHMVSHIYYFKTDQLLQTLKYYLIHDSDQLIL